VLVVNSIGYCEGGHLLVVSVEEKSSLGGPFVVNYFECAAELCVGTFWIEIGFVNFAEDVERDIIVELECDVFFPLKGMRIELLVLLLIAESILFISNLNSPDSHGHNSFLKLHLNVFYHQHLFDNYIYTTPPIKFHQKT
jgi:hypothetical protein